MIICCSFVLIPIHAPAPVPPTPQPLTLPHVSHAPLPPLLPEPHTKTPTPSHPTFTHTIHKTTYKNSQNVTFSKNAIEFMNVKWSGTTKTVTEAEIEL